MKLLLISATALMLTLQGCFPTDKYDTRYTVPARTFVGVNLDITIHYQVRCGVVGGTVVVLDTFGQIAMLGDTVAPSEALMLEGMVKDHAREVCSA